MAKKKLSNQDCCTYVGLFLQKWNTIEEVVNQAIARSLNLTVTQKLILCSNIQFRDKINILKTAIEASNLGGDAKAHYKREADKIGEFNKRFRNVVAHNTFTPSDDGQAIQFWLIRARGEIEFPDEKWSPQFMADHLTRMDEFNETLNNLSNALNNVDFRFGLAQALSQPTQEGAGPGLLGLLDTLLQEDPNSDANLPIAPAPPPEPEDPKKK